MGNQFKTFIMALACATFPTLTFAQPAKAWTKTYGFSAPQCSNSEYVRCNSAGNTFVVRKKFSRTCDNSLGYVEVTKYTAAGAPMWTSNFGGLGAGTTTPFAFELDPGGNAILATSDYATGVFGATVLTKINGATGATIWKTNVTEIYQFYGLGFVIGSTGDIFIGGQGTNTGDRRMGVTKVSGATGFPIWNKVVTRTASGISDLFSDLAIDSSGNLAIVGTARTSNFCTNSPVSSIVSAKMNGSTGSVIWANAYTNNSADKNNNPLVAVDAAGNLFACATTTRGATGLWIVIKKAAANGALTFAKVITPSGFFLSQATSFVSDTAGGVTLCGSSFGPTSGIRFYKFSSTGVQSWSRVLADRSTLVQYLFGKRRRNLMAVGSSALVCAFQSDTVGNTLITRLHQTTGATVWEKTYTPVPGTPTEPIDLALASNSDPVFVANVNGAGNTGPRQAPVARLGISTGNPVFGVLPNLVSANTVDGGQGLVIDGTGNTFSVGFSAGRIITQKHNSAGTLLWQNIFDNSALDFSVAIDDGGRHIGRDGAGNIVVAGNNRGQFTVVKINGGTGATIWNRRLNVTPGNNIAVGSNGDIFVPCQSPSQLIKLRPSDGLPVWTVPVNGSEASDDADFVAVDAASNPFVAGTTSTVPICPNPSTEKLLVQKFNNVNGNLLWTREVAPPVAGSNQPAGIVVDTNGGVLVAGTVDTATSSDIFTTRFAASTGAVFWNTRHDLGGKSQFAAAVTKDFANNLIVTSATSASATVYNGWTIKVANSNGARLWANLLTLPQGSQLPTDVKTDSLNNVFVGGVTIRGTTTQLFGQKINGSNGVQLWEALTPNGVIFENRSVSVAITPSNRLEMCGSVAGTSPGLSQWALVQYLQ